MELKENTETTVQQEDNKLDADVRYGPWTPLPSAYSRGPIYCTCLECGASIMGWPFIEERIKEPDAIIIHNEWHDRQDANGR